jgi:hypothetical protein
VPPESSDLADVDHQQEQTAVCRKQRPCNSVRPRNRNSSHGILAAFVRAQVPVLLSRMEFIALLYLHETNKHLQHHPSPSSSVWCCQNSLLGAHSPGTKMTAVNTKQRLLSMPRLLTCSRLGWLSLVAEKMLLAQDEASSNLPGPD